MITREFIMKLVNENLDNRMFLVDVNVKPSNVIHVEIDHFDGLSIDHCVSMSRSIESHLNREEEDFELQVSSPGLDQYFKVKPQFYKNVGRELDIMTHQNGELRGVLVEAGENVITLEILTRETVEGNKKKLTVKKLVSIDYQDIMKAKVVISFK